jgi:hypothetical protein
MEPFWPAMRRSSTGTASRSKICACEASGPYTASKLKDLAPAARGENDLEKRAGAPVLNEVAGMRLELVTGGGSHRAFIGVEPRAGVSGATAQSAMKEVLSGDGTRQRAARAHAPSRTQMELSLMEENAEVSASLDSGRTRTATRTLSAAMGQLCLTVMDGLK